MREHRRGAGWLVTACILVARPSAARSPARRLPEEAVVPLIHAHAHNDYRHARPLLDALACGFCSVEADVYLVSGALLVAHDLADTRPEHTLQALYLDPLRERVRANGGRVYRGGPTVTLLIDVKSDPASTWAALKTALRPYAAMLTRFRNGREERGAVTVLVSGGRARAEIEADPDRCAALDGELSDLESEAPLTLVPQISIGYWERFSWLGGGAMPREQRETLRRLVAQAHAKGRRIRFWAAPDSPTAWRLLRDEQVDLINTDRLTALRDFFQAEPERRMDSAQAFTGTAWRARVRSQ